MSIKHMVGPSDESRRPSQSNGQDPWLICEVALKWKWTMVKGCNIFYEKSNLIDSPGSPPWQYNISSTQWQFNCLSKPLVPSDPPLFDGLMQYPIDHKKLSTCYHVGRHVDFSSNWIYLILQLHCKVHSNSSIKWPYAQPKRAYLSS